MLQVVKRRLQDVRTLSRICTLAEAIAHQDGRPRPASEHFVLAALALPDRTAAHAFSQLGIDERRFRDALAAQRSQALASVGVDATLTTPFPAAPPAPKPALYQAQASGQALVKRLADTRKARVARRLLGADVLLAAAQEEHTASSRAFKGLGISPATLAAAASSALERAAEPVRT
jgi:hypothetical protein